MGEIVDKTDEKSSFMRVFDVEKSAGAEAHIKFFGAATEAQCWLLSGYLTGLCSDHTQPPVYFLETMCIAKGDSVCRFVGKRREHWSLEEDADLSPFEEQNVAFELASAQEQLVNTKERYQNLFEQSSMPIFIIDPDTGTYMNANIAAEELTGYPLGELVTKKIFDLHPPQEHHEIILQMKNLLATGRSSDEEVHIVRKDGAIRTMARSSKVLPYGGRRVVQVIMRDITDLKLSAQKEKDLHQQLLRSERLSSIGRLAAGVAHELKNPLGAIKNAIYYIRNALHTNPVMETDPHLKEIMKLAENEIDQSVTIIGELLDFSRVVRLMPRKTQINELLEQLPNIVRVPENVKLSFNLDLTLPSATVDPGRLNQVFTNLMTNAIQAMQNGGELKIGSQYIVEFSSDKGVNQERVMISFEDTGSGIDPAHRAKIFEPLFTTKAQGTGLGLAISNNIIEKHGGAISVTSQVGKGTCFTVRIPLVAPSDEEELK
jgi:PAS domain S-box-containing protein